VSERSTLTSHGSTERTVTKSRVTKFKS